MFAISTSNLKLSVKQVATDEQLYLDCSVHHTEYGDGSFAVALSNHVLERCNERRINKEVLGLALCCSESIQKQGLLFHVVTQKMLPKGLTKNLKNRLENLVVVTNDAADCILTAYRAKKALSKTRKKIKANWMKG